MSDPNTPSITDAGTAPVSHTISLNDLGQKYLGALQRIFDTAAFIVEGARQVNERTYDDFSSAVRFLPSQQQHRSFDAAKEEAERWMLRNLLADAFSVAVPFLEDIRSVAALAHWKAETPTDQQGLQRILGEDRRAFLALDLAEKFAYLQNTHGISSQLSAQVQALAKVGTCLTARGGVVSERDLTDGGELSFSLVALQLIPMQQGSVNGGSSTGEAGATIVPQFGELRRTFGVGQTIKLEKADYLNVITTLSLFVSSILKSLQENVKKAQAAE